MCNHSSIYLSLSFCKFPNSINSNLWPSLLSFKNMSSFLLEPEGRTYPLFNDFQIVLELVLQTYPLFNNSQNALDLFFQLRTRVTLCCVHNMVLDDINNMAHLSTTIIVLSSISTVPLAI
jgi:hypothetical protein